MRKVKRAFLAAAMTVSVSAAGGTVLGDPEVRIEPPEGIPMSRYNQAAWWSPIAVGADGAVYMSYLSESSPEDNVYVARRSPEGDWTLNDTGATSPYNIGHTQTSLAIDGDGHLHLFYGMHSTREMLYRRTGGAAGETMSFVSRREEFPGGGHYTYPNLGVCESGDLYLVVRNRRAGTTSITGTLFRWDNGARRWSDRRDFAWEDGYVVYPNDIQVHNGIPHLTWEWSERRGRVQRHLGTYVRHDWNRNRFYTAGSRAIGDGPVSLRAGDIFQPMEDGQAWNDLGIQSAKMAIDSDGHPMIAYAFSPAGADRFEHRFARWDGNKWRVRTMSRPGMRREKPWISYRDGMIRYYTALEPGRGDLYLKTSSDGGATWSDPAPVARGLRVDRPAGISQGGTDYLYLPSTVDRKLYLAIVADRSTSDRR